MAVDLLLQVTGDQDNRVSGSVCARDGAEAHTISGTLALTRACEELVPAQRVDEDAANAGRPGDQRANSSPPS